MGDSTIEFERIKLRVLQIAGEVSDIEVSRAEPNEITAGKLKLIAIKYNCYMNSWVTFYECVAQVYEASVYNEDIDDTWELISGKTEAEAIIIGFKWLADKGYFVKK